jgi:lysophospholipase L1-like esterase
MSHVILLGDSIFDNASYVPGEAPVVEQLRQNLPAGWRATLLAVDGHITADVALQLQRLPADATHLVVSVGGNDALRESSILFAVARSGAEVLGRLADARKRFAVNYRQMLRVVQALGRPTMVCTIYEAIPGLEPAAQAGLAGFNDVILLEAFAAKLPVLDLRLICTEPEDYSSLSPIEPSATGGEKITAALAGALANHDFSRRQSVIYP